MTELKDVLFFELRKPRRVKKLGLSHIYKTKFLKGRLWEQKQRKIKHIASLIDGKI